MPLHPRITHVVPRDHFEVLLRFADGSSGVVDLAPWIVGRRGVFAALQDASMFRSVTVDRDAGTLVWPNGADLDPDVLYEAAHATPANSSSANRRI